MTVALIRKELRELAPWLAAALLADVILVLGMIQPDSLNRLYGGLFKLWYLPFQSSDSIMYLVLITLATALVVGFRQTVPEDLQRTYLYLLHLPTTRRAIILVKVMVGATAVFVVAALPIVVIGLWATTPGSLPGPYTWRMTEPAWQVAVSGVLVYLAVFLSGLRPARWWFSRLFPIVTALLLMMICMEIPWMWLAYTVPPVSSLLMLLAADAVATTRDFG